MKICKLHLERRMLTSIEKARYIVLTLFVVLFSQPISAQENPWVIGLYTNSNHVITHDVLSYAKGLINGAIAIATEGVADMDITPVKIHYMSMKDNGEEIDFQTNNPYGMTAYDLFNDVEFGVQFGWQGPFSPVGIILHGAYAINQYKLKFLGDRTYSKHKIQSWRVGADIRISPLRFLMEDHNWCPIIEIGTTYVKNFKYKGPYDSDSNQLNSGIRTRFAIGAQFESGDILEASFEMNNYDMFNRNYTSDGGYWFPYANYKNKDYVFGLIYKIKIGEDD